MVIIPFDGMGRVKQSLLGMERIVITTAQDGEYLAFPDLVRMDNGNLWLVYRKGKTHVGNDERLMKIAGSSDGLHWGKNELLYDHIQIDDRVMSNST